MSENPTSAVPTAPNLGSLSQAPHRRFNPLIGEWTLVSPHRTQRPWQGAQEKTEGEQRPAYDPTCYLCPGNDRASGDHNPNYEDTFVFTNDFAALKPTPEGKATSGLFRAEPTSGECRVICFSPRHDLTLAHMEEADIAKVIDLWAAQAQELGAKWRWVQVFENKGAMMGCSNPHPHGQIWASDFLPTIVAKEDAAQKAYFEANGRPMLADVAQAESGGERVVAENEDWLLLVPFWATWPFEYLLLPKFKVSRLEALTGDQRVSLSQVLKKGLMAYDSLFDTSFPYTMGWHGAPYSSEAGSAPDEAWTLHAHFYPPLLRSATVRKFMVGYEMLAEPQRDLTPELAAARLRETMPA